LTVLPDVVLPNRNENELPTRFWGLSREWNRPVKMLKWRHLRKMGIRKGRPIGRPFYKIL
jgi:hypothetical protein